jgi:hypothetical protein
MDEETATLEDVAGMAGVAPTTASNHFRRLGLQAKPRHRKRTDAEVIAGELLNELRELRTPATAEAPEAGADEPFSWHDYITDEVAAAPEIEDDLPEPAPADPREHSRGVGAQTVSPAGSTALLDLARLLQSAALGTLGTTQVTGTIRLQLSADLEVSL